MEYSTIFKSHNVRATPLREKIYDVIATKKSAISKKEIEEKLNDLDRITLYRTLKIFKCRAVPIIKRHVFALEKKSDINVSNLVPRQC